VHVVYGEVDIEYSETKDLDEVAGVYWKNQGELRDMIDKREITAGASLAVLGLFFGGFLG